MTKMTNDTDRKDKALERAVERLNIFKDSKDVATCLGKFVGEGLPKSSYACPVALYLTDKVGVQVQVTYSYAYLYIVDDLEPSHSVRLSDTVTDFIRSFDQVEVTE
jgi:hypothetical protein